LKLYKEIVVLYIDRRIYCFMTNIDEEWLEFINSSMNGMSIHNNPIQSSKSIQKIDLKELQLNKVAPECDELYISTKTKFLFLNQ
jgi:hypothetical protein